MKDFIIASALFILLMFFPIQYGINEVNHHHIRISNEIIHNAAQKARTSGRFTPEIVDEMRTQLVDKLYVHPDEILINVTTTPKYRLTHFDEREMIEYDIQIPISKIIAMANFFSISNAENSMYYPIQGSVPSEVPAP